MPTLIELKDDRSEKVHYDTPDYPIYIRRGLLSSHPNYAAPSHWHNDIELIAVLAGEMKYNVILSAFSCIRAFYALYLPAKTILYCLLYATRQCPMWFWTRILSGRKKFWNKCILCMQEKT